MRTRFSKGNRKLSKNVLIWNLPRLTTCPGAGDCKDWCYEIKFERMYKNVLPFRETNLILTRSSYFISNTVQYLNSAEQPHVRIHESGDFYSQKYLNSWKEIARQCPNKNFYAYTKSFHLDLWTKLPPNFQILQSTGSKWDHLIDKSKAVFRVEKNPLIASNEIMCSGGGCGSKCMTCIPRSNVKVVEVIHR